MKQHIPWRTVQTNPFNKDMFKGNQEKVNDWDLDTTLYVYEPQSLADLGDDASELDYQKVWNKFEAGGHINIYLVPYREMPEIKAEITSIAADYDGLDKNETIAAYTNVPMGDRPTKRFYSFKPLTESEDPIINLEIFEENNLTEVINNDSTFKQTTFTLNKFQVYDGGEGSYYRDVRFFYGVFKPEAADFLQVSYDTPSVIGSIGMRDLYGANFNRELMLDTIVSSNTTLTIFKAIGEDLIIYKDRDNQMFPHFLPMTNTGQEINVRVPWVWEYIYGLEQQKALKIVGDGTTDDLAAANGLLDYPEKVWQGDRMPDIIYTHINNGEFAGAAEQTDYFMEYIVEFGLPRELSSHGSTYVSDSSNSANKGLFNLEYTDNSLAGARAERGSHGAWFSETTMLALDFAYDEGVWLAGSMDLYISSPVYGSFYQSDRYRDLITSVLYGSPLYQGTVFSSDIGVLDDIEDDDFTNDFRKWSVSDDNKMLLLPWDIKELAVDYATRSPKYLDSEVVIAKKNPKTRTGIWDWSGGQSIEIIDGEYMYGKYIDNDKIKDLPYTPKTILFEIDDNEHTLGQLWLNYLSFIPGTIKVQLYKKDIIGNIKIYEEIYNNEKSQGRNLSGGTVITWL